MDLVCLEDVDDTCSIASFITRLPLNEINSINWHITMIITALRTEPERCRFLLECIWYLAGNYPSFCRIIAS